MGSPSLAVKQDKGQKNPAKAAGFFCGPFQALFSESSQAANFFSPLAFVAL
jgi:hypothetical protein